MGKPTTAADWHMVNPCKEGIINTDCVFDGDSYISNDRQWVWKRKEYGGADWFPLADHVSQQQTAPYGAKERTGSMLHTIAVTTRPVGNSATNQIVQPEKLVAGPDNTIVAPDQSTALMVFGAKYADKLDGVDPSMLVVNYRQGV